MPADSHTSIPACPTLGLAPYVAQTIPCDSKFGPVFAYTLHEPIGVVGQIIPWNFPREPLGLLC
jgi:acyl-CoA reductase-like NAD-dependent aldehyde dehydrogenase